MDTMPLTTKNYMEIKNMRPIYRNQNIEIIRLNPSDGSSIELGWFESMLVTK